MFIKYTLLIILLFMWHSFVFSNNDNNDIFLYKCPYIYELFDADNIKFFKRKDIASIKKHSSRKQKLTRLQENGWENVFIPDVNFTGKKIVDSKFLAVNYTTDTNDFVLVIEVDSGVKDNLKKVVADKVYSNYVNGRNVFDLIKPYLGYQQHINICDETDFKSSVGILAATSIITMGSEYIEVYYSIDKNALLLKRFYPNKVMLEIIYPSKNNLDHLVKVKVSVNDEEFIDNVIRAF